MLRRQFLKITTLAGVSGLATIGTAEAGDTETVKYRVEGFSCITCAVGLETMLRQQKGVVWVKASYPDASVVIKYDSASVTENAIRAFITDMGFSAEPEPTPPSPT